MLTPRKTALAALKETASSSQPILIVGGGINGIGLFRDLALQGVPAVLIDKGDFASGTSAASSRLIHGGLRYLETGEFALVKESVIERNALLANAPHLVRPLPVLVPAYSYFGGLFSAGLRFLKLKKTPGPKGIVAVKLGLTFFDRFGRRNQQMPNHTVLSAKAGRRKVPGLSPSIRAVAQYYDTRVVCPERLALELVGDAERDCPQSIALTYTEVAETQGQTVTLRDMISGEEIALTPRLVVNCTGAWVDRVNAALGLETQLMGGTQGSHLVLERPDIAAQLGESMLYFETKDFRACLIYALDDRRILMGTTDIRAAEIDAPVCTQDEIDYIFEVTEQVLPGAGFKRADISYTYAGIRPLPASNDTTTGAISRDHSFRLYPRGDGREFDMLVLVGGKWTTYRACAEQLADRVLDHIKTPRRDSTLTKPIGGGAGFGAAERATLYHDLGALLPRDLADKLIERYGARARQVAPHVVATPSARVIGTGYHPEEIRWILRGERVAHLADLVLRRTRLPFEGPIGQDSLLALADLCAEELGWDAARIADEVQAVKTELATRHHMQVV